MTIINYYDTEVKKSPEEVGWKNYREMGFSVGCVIKREYDEDYNVVESTEKSFVDDPKAMAEFMNKEGYCIGFNNKNFDDNLITHFAGGDQEYLFNTLDILQLVDEVAGYKFSTSLDNLCKATINKSKTGDGADAPKLWQNERIKQLTDYCMNDVQLTGEIFEFGLKYGYILINLGKNKDLYGNMVLKLPVDWGRLL